MKGRSISLQIASCSPDGARALLEEAIRRFETGEVEENGKLIHGVEGEGCAMMYLWPESD